MPPLGTRIFTLTAALFLVGALLVALLRLATPRVTEGIWRTFALQVALSVLVLVPALVGGAVWTAALALVVLVGASEIFGVLERAALGPARSVGLLATAALSAASTLGEPVASVLGLLLCALCFATRKRAVKLSGLCLGLLFPAVCAGFVWRVGRLGAGDLVFLYTAVELNDSAAYLGGKALGRHALSARVSPNKTWEGALCGLAAAAGSGGLFAFVEPGWPTSLCILLGLGLGVLGTCGDLAASAIKRRAGVKDWSSLLPGHGGLLDAYDSLLLVAPFWYALLRALRA